MRLFALIGGLIVAVLLAALIGPYFIDWSEYRGKFEQAASSILRQPVRVAGNASARLLPFPSLTLTDVRVGPDEVPLMVAKQFSLDAELAPFLSGEFLIFDMRIEDPVVTLEVDTDGNPVWPAHEAIGRMAATDVIRDVTVEKATVTGGQALIRDAARDRQLRITDIAMTVGVDSLTGPIRAEGTAVVGGVPITMDGATGLLARDGFALRTRTEWQSRGLVVATQGRLNRSDARRTEYDGVFQLKPSGEEPGWTSEGVFLADAKGVAVDQYRALFGDQADPYIVEGSASLDASGEPQFTLVARGNQFNVEKQVATSDDTASRDRMAEIGSVLARIPVPPIPGTVELNLPAVIIGDTTVRDVKLDAKPAKRSGDLGAAWDISNASAQLPGRTAIEAAGLVTFGELPEFSGHVVVASRQPSGLASWLGVSGDERITALSRAGLEADLEFTPLSQTATGVLMALDSAVFTGDVQRRVTSGRPLISLGLEGQSVGQKSLDAIQAMLRGPDGEAGIGASHDIDLALDMNDVAYGDLTADNVVLGARMRPGRTDFDRISINGLLGGSVSATAVMRTESGVVNSDFDVSAVAVDGAPFLSGLARAAGFAALADHVDRVAIAGRKPFDNISLTAKGSRESASGDLPAQAVLSLNGEIGGSAIISEIAVGGDVETFDDQPLTIDASVQNDRAATLFAQLGYDALANEATGAGDLTLRLNGVPSVELETALAAKAGKSELHYDGTSSFSGQTMTGKGAIAVSGEDLRPFVKAVGLPVSDQSLVADMKSSLEMTGEGAFALPDITGVLAGDPVAGNLAWKPDVVMSEKGTLSGKVNLGSVDLDRGLAAFLGHDLPIAGDTLVDAPMAAGIGLDLDIEADRLELGGLAPLENATFKARRDGNQLTFSNVAGAFMEGTAKGRFSLQNDGQNVLANGQLSLDRIPLERLLPSHANTLSGISTSSFGFSANGRNLDALLGSVTGSGSLAVGEVTVTGLNGSALPELVEKADEIGFEIKPEQTAALARDVLLSGETTFLPVQTPLNITNGTAHISNVVTTSQGVTARASADLDLASWATSSRTVLDFDAGTFAQTGVGPSLTITREGDGVETDAEPLVAFITQRALEREQARIEALQARLLERQRLRRALRLAKYERQARLDAEEAERIRLENERIEAERRAAEAAQRAAEEEAERQRQLQEAAEKARKAIEERARAEAERARQQVPERQQAVPDDAPQILQELPQIPGPQPSRL